MIPFRVHTGLVAPLERANVDTDQIIPKQFLKRIERTGFGEFLFYDWRRLGNGELKPGKYALIGSSLVAGVQRPRCQPRTATLILPHRDQP